jgi:hypothetical protein
MTDIPLYEDEIINEVTVTRRGKRSTSTPNPFVSLSPPLPPQPVDTVPDACRA